MTARKSLAERDRAHLWHPYTQHGTEGPPLEVAGARGAELRLAEHDFSSGNGSTSVEISLKMVTRPPRRPCRPRTAG